MGKRRLPLLIFEGLLLLGLLRGLLWLGNPNIPRLPLFIGIAINLFIQACIVTAFRKQKNAESLSPEDQSVSQNRQRLVMKTVAMGAGIYAALLMANVALFISHKYSARIFASVALAEMISMFLFLFIRLTKVQKAGATGN
jgi:hypothetical protein